MTTQERKGSIVGSEAISFLQRFAPNGPWILTAIPPSRKGIETKTFLPSSIKECEEWIAARNGNQNLYFSVNPTKVAMTKKAAKKDIARVEWLHVDLDPRAGEDLEAERERILERLTTRLPEGVPAPTVVIDSGGGYWGFWKLESPFEVGGDVAKAKEIERYNVQLEVLFGADSCHDICRISRLPGTLNIPDDTKRKKGRK